VKEISTSGGERAARIGKARLGIGAFSSTAGTISSIFTKAILATFAKKCQNSIPRFPLQRIQFYFANWDGKRKNKNPWVLLPSSARSGRV